MVIAAGALLKDNQTGKVLAQLKFKSLSTRPIRALTVLLCPKDVAGVALEQVSHRYLDLDAGYDTEFCQKMPVPLPNAETRSYSAAVTEVVFADGSIWRAEEGLWEPLPKPVSATQGRDLELVKQYRLEYGENKPYLLQEYRDLWFCPCGTVNRLGEDCNCHNCRSSLSGLRSISWEVLEEHKKARLAEEAAQAEQARAAAEAEAEKKRAAAKKLAPIVLPILAVAIVAAVLFSGYMKKVNAYEAAEALFAEEKYDEAETAFAALGDFRDSATQVENVKTAQLDDAYDKAVSLMEKKEYDSAIQAFDALDGYRDSAEQIAQIETARLDEAYENACSLYREKEYVNAAIAFKELGDYKDSADQLDMIYEYAVILSKTRSEGYKDMAEAANIFQNALVDYKDSAEHLRSIEAVLEPEYQKTVHVLNLAIMEHNFFSDLKAKKYYEEAKQLFVSLGNYKDSAQLAQGADEMIRELEKKNDY